MDLICSQCLPEAKKFNDSAILRWAIHPATRFFVLFTVMSTMSGCSGQRPADSGPDLIIRAFNYHQYSPYVIESNVTENNVTENNGTEKKSRRGLSDDWVKHINRYLTHARLELVNVDRSTLNNLLKNDKPGMILWGNPTWFGAYPGIEVSVPILVDGDMLVSSATNPVVELSPQAGYRLCAIKGYVYPTTVPWISNGALRRIDRESTAQCLAAIQEKQADIALINRSQWLYLPDDERKHHWYMMPQPIDAFARHVLVTRHYASLLPELNAAIISVNNDKEWQRLLLNYGSQDFLNLFDLRLDQLQALPLPKME